jgi:hypothetical protein
MASKEREENGAVRKAVERTRSSGVAYCREQPPSRASDRPRGSWVLRGECGPRRGPMLGGGIAWRRRMRSLSVPHRPRFPCCFRNRRKRGVDPKGLATLRGRCPERRDAARHLPAEGAGGAGRGATGPIGALGARWPPWFPKLLRRPAERNPRHRAARRLDWIAGGRSRGLVDSDGTGTAIGYRREGDSADEDRAP